MSQDNRADLGSYDYVIVGAGSAGCTLANRLSADPEIKVLLLEAGGKDSNIWIHIPVGYLFTMNNPKTDWCFMTEPEPGLNGRALNYPRGKTLGGSSSINGMIYMRGQARDYDQWRQLGNVGWSWDDVLPYFRRCEDQQRGADEFHGTGGELRIENPRVRWDILDAFREAAAEVGIPKIDDFNRGDNEGCTYFQVHQRGGLRWSAAKGFLRPAMNRPNLRVVTHAQASRILIEGKRATGVAFEVRGAPSVARASGEVILATGAIGSPQLLELSGVGRGEVLSGFGIPLLHELKGVGENLQDHLQLRLCFKVQNTVTLNERSHRLWDKAMMAAQYALFRSGPISMAPSQLGCFAKSDPSLETANLQYHIQPLTTDKLGEPLHRFPGLTASVCNLRPQSRGTCHIRDRSPATPPAIKPNYLSDKADQKVAADAIRLTRRILAAPAMARFAPEEFMPGPGLQSEEELVRGAGDIGTTIFHPVSTCKMGHDPMAVVDDRLRVHGLEGLRVVDASIMPTITSGNTNAPTIMIADKASDLIKEDRRAGSRKAA